QTNTALASSRAAVQGARNDALFAALRIQAQDCESLDDLTLYAHAVNAQFSPPLPKAEAEKVVMSVWRMKMEGRIIQKGQQRIQLFLAELESLTADGLYFLSWLKRWHGAKNGGPFALSAKAMDKAHAIPGWGARRIVAATRELRASGVL